MAKLFIGISLALMVVTASLGFLAKANIDKLKSGWSETKLSLAKEQANLQTAKNDLKKTSEDLALANDKVKETTLALESKTMELSKQSQLLADAQKEVENQIAEVEKLKKLLVAAEPPVVPGGPDPKIAINELTEKLQKAQMELAEKEALLAAITNSAKANEAKLSELQLLEKKRGTFAALPGLHGRILAVNAGWNFVVLNVGDKQGVPVNAPLLVVRGNSPIARLRITSVESSTSVADLIPSSVARGVTVQPGDTVIFEGRTPATELPKPTVEAEPAKGSPRST